MRDLIYHHRARVIGQPPQYEIPLDSIYLIFCPAHLHIIWVTVGGPQ